MADALLQLFESKEDASTNEEFMQQKVVSTQKTGMQPRDTQFTWPTDDVASPVSAGTCSKTQK